MLFTSCHINEYLHYVLNGRYETGQISFIILRNFCLLQQYVQELGKVTWTKYLQTTLLSLISASVGAPSATENSSCHDLCSSWNAL